MEEFRKEVKEKVSEWYCRFSKQSPVHTAPEKFENSVFTLKTHQMFEKHEWKIGERGMPRNLLVTQDCILILFTDTLKTERSCRHFVDKRIMLRYTLPIKQLDHELEISQY